MERAAYTIAQAVQAGAGSRATIYEQINKGRLRARKRGRSTIILADDLRAFLESLPAIQPKTVGSSVKS
jgi:Helix-turn-helix domain